MFAERAQRIDRYTVCALLCNVRHVLLWRRSVILTEYYYIHFNMINVFSIRIDVIVLCYTDVACR